MTCLFFRPLTVLSVLNSIRSISTKSMPMHCYPVFKRKKSNPSKKNTTRKRRHRIYSNNPVEQSGNIFNPGICPRFPQQKMPPVRLCPCMPSTQCAAADRLQQFYFTCQQPFLSAPTRRKRPTFRRVFIFRITVLTEIPILSASSVCVI